jgi:hypothetical protein
MNHSIFRLVPLLTLLLALGVLSSCGSGGSESPSPPVTGNKWTVMVYLDADNNLGTASMLDLEEMQAVGSTENATFIVQHDTHGGTTKRYKVEKGSLTLLGDLGELDMSDGATLRDFVSSSATAYPADHYALIIWNHGQGWKAATGGSVTKSIFNDVDNGKPSTYLSNYYVAAALAEAESAAGIKLDILGVDACEMSVIEAAYEFRNVAQILVASQELVSSYGWNYDDLFGRLVKDPAMSPATFAKDMVTSFKKYYEAAGYKDQTITALALSALYSTDGVSTIGSVAQAVNNLALQQLALMADSTTRAATLKLLTDSRAAVQEFDLDVLPATYVDLVDLSRLIAGGNSAIELAFNKLLLAEYHGSERPNAHGLSIVFNDRSSPADTAVYDPNYRNYDPATGTGSRIAFINQYNWDEMLHTYYGYQYPLKPN